VQQPLARPVVQGQLQARRPGPPQRLGEGGRARALAPRVHTLAAAARAQAGSRPRPGTCPRSSPRSRLWRPLRTACGCGGLARRHGSACSSPPATGAQQASLQRRRAWYGRWRRGLGEVSAFLPSRWQQRQRPSVRLGCVTSQSVTWPSPCAPQRTVAAWLCDNVRVCASHARDSFTASDGCSVDSAQ